MGSVYKVKAGKDALLVNQQIISETTDRFSITFGYGSPTNQLIEYVTN
jgi:hypothetical protein